MHARVLVVDDSPTIRKVVQTMLASRGHTVIVSADGHDALRLLSQHSVDLILLDFVMPNMNGFQFCQALRALESGRDTPVILMSAKADRIRDRFIAQTGAVDYISKPFNSVALTSVVEGTLQRIAQFRSPVSNQRASDIPQSDGPVSSRARIRTQTVQPQLAPKPYAEFAHALAQAVSPSIEQAAREGLCDEDRIRDIVEAALLTAEIRPALKRLKQSIAPGSDDALVGDLAAVPVGEVLQLLQMQHQTGTLEITHQNMVIMVHMRDGFVNLAQCTNSPPELLLGRYLLERELITAAELETAVVDAKRHGELIGEWLVSTNAITKQDLQAALVRQTSEIIYEAIRWKQGTFLFRRNVLRQEPESAALALPVGSIVMEGIRRVDEWGVIEQTVQSDEVLERTSKATPAEIEQLTKLERTVFDDIDGKRCIGDIIDKSLMASFDVCTALYHLLQSSLVRRANTT